MNKKKPENSNSKYEKNISKYEQKIVNMKKNNSKNVENAHDQPRYIESRTFELSAQN